MLPYRYFVTWFLSCNEVPNMVEKSDVEILTVVCVCYK